MAAPVSKWPLKELLDVLREISAKYAASKRWSDADAAKAKAAVGAFCLSQETMTIPQVESTWRDAFAAVLEMYAQTGSAEASMLAQNFAGLVLWRLSITWNRSSIKTDSEKLIELIDKITGDEAISWLTRNNLRVSSRYGPVDMRKITFDWMAVFSQATDSAFSYSPEKMIVDIEKIPKTEELTFKLVHKRFDLIYDFQFVQDGIRLVSRSIGWVVPFVITSRCTSNRVYTPLTRVLYTIALVDKYLRDREPQPRELIDRFAEDVETLTQAELMTPAEANATKRTAHEVRVSSAVAYGDPFVLEVRPGMASIRVRTGPEILASATSLTRDAMAVHISAVLKLISGESASDGSVYVLQAMTNLYESARAAWDAVQTSTTQKQVLEALIDSGFVPQACLAYENALKSQFARSYNPPAETNDGVRESYSPFDDTQQAVGCMAVIGNVVFGLAESYGPGLDYLDIYLDATFPDAMEQDEFIRALGLPQGAIAQILGRCMPPRTFPEYIKTARSALVSEINESEILIESERPSLTNAAREALLMWFDYRADDSWGVVAPADERSSSSLTTIDESSTLEESIGERLPTPVTDSRVTRQREIVMMRNAVNIRYPEPMPGNVAELTDPSYARYVVATAVADAMTATASAAFSLPHINLAIKVLTWAKDYGAPYIQNFDGHKNKLTALISSLLPFIGEVPQHPTPEDGANVESLLGELHAVVASATGSLNIQNMAPPPKPDITNSTLLVSMYATALRLNLDALIDDTLSLASNLSTASWSLADYVATAKAFFSAKFYSTYSGGLVTLKGRSDNASDIGTWRVNDIAAAVGDIYNACSDAIADIRVASMSIRSLVEETGRRIQICDALASRATGNGASRVFSVLSADYARLSGVHASLDMHVRKLVACSEPPGMKDVNWFLKKWTKISSLDSTPRDATDLLHVIEDIGAIWREAAAKRASSISQKTFPSDSEIEDAVLDTMEDYKSFDDGDVAPVVVLTARHNLITRDEINYATLRYETVTPEGVDPAEFAEDFITKDRISADVLMRLVDSVFNVGRVEAR